MANAAGAAAFFKKASPSGKFLEFRPGHKPATQPMSSGFRNGLIASATVVAYFLAFYFFDKKLFLNPVVSWASMLFYVALMWKAEVDERAAFGGRIAFKPALRAGFQVFLMANVAYWFLFYGLCLSDHGLTDILKNWRLEEIQKLLTGGTGDPQVSNELRKEAEEITRDGFRIGLGDVLLRLSMGLLGGFVIAAAIAFFVKNETEKA